MLLWGNVVSLNLATWGQLGRSLPWTRY